MPIKFAAVVLVSCLTRTRRQHNTVYSLVVIQTEQQHKMHTLANKLKDKKF